MAAQRALSALYPMYPCPLLRPGLQEVCGVGSAGHHMKSMDKAGDLAITPDGEAKCVALWEDEPCV